MAKYSFYFKGCPPVAKREAPHVPPQGIKGKAVTFTHKGVKLFGVAGETSGGKVSVTLALPMERKLLAGETVVPVDESALSTVDMEATSGKFMVGKRQCAGIASTDTKATPVRDGSAGVVSDWRDVTISGYASTFSHVTESDRVGDAVAPGAFKDTLPRFRENPVMLLDHNNSTRHIAGKYVTVREDATGLFVEGQVTNAPELRQTRFALMEGSLKTLSIGGIWFYAEDGRTIVKAHLFEISLVAIPANPDAIISARSLDLDALACIMQTREA